jgi:hypothetical protein
MQRNKGSHCAICRIFYGNNCKKNKNIFISKMTTTTYYKETFPVLCWHSYNACHLVKLTLQCQQVSENGTFHLLFNISSFVSSPSGQGGFFVIWRIVFILFWSFLINQALFSATLVFPNYFIVFQLIHFPCYEITITILFTLCSSHCVGK